MQFDILTLFPEMFPGPLGASILKRAMQASLLGVRLHQIRDFTHDRHHTVDDYPYGGGAGMVMKAPPLFEAVEHVLAQPPGPPGLYVCRDGAPPEVLVAPEADAPEAPAPAAGAAPPVILMSPTGRVFTQRIAAELAALPRIVLVCGHYEGLDERIREALISDEISIGDYVLTGGEPAALVVLDATARLVPGVLAEGSTAEESHASGLLEYPQYTRPDEYKGKKVPTVLTGGNHKDIEKWKLEKAVEETKKKRPDLLDV